MINLSGEATEAGTPGHVLKIGCWVYLLYLHKHCEKTSLSGGHLHMPHGSGEFCFLSFEDIGFGIYACRSVLFPCSVNLLLELFIF